MLNKFKASLFAIATGTMLLASCNGDHNYAPADTTSTPVALENIMTRTSVRQYTGKQIPADTLDILLKAAMAAPSAMNKQPWEFVVVNNADLRAALADVVGDRTKTAGAVIVVCGNRDRFLPQMPEYWVQDCSAATENLLLAANACRLGAVWNGVYPQAEKEAQIRQILSLPETLVPLNIVTVGYPTAINNPKDKWDPSKVTVID